MNTLAKLIIALSLAFSMAFATTVGHAQTYSTHTSEEFSRAELDQMLAPIALYPDTVLSHVLIAATYPLEVVRADRWAQNNSHLDAEAAVQAVEYKNWDPSVRALVAFPQILQRLSEDLDWTQRLGDAFLLDEAQVMHAIQDLRQRAYAAGSLNNMKHVNVQREKKIIIIEPAVERVVYIPYYDTRVVYGNWRWRDYPPTYWHHPRDHLYVGGFYWGPRAYLGVSFFSTSFHWHQRRVVYVDRSHHRHRSLPNLYTSRKIASYEGARHWQHNPKHRRGVAYRNERLREHYGGHRSHLSAQQDRRESLRSGSDIRRVQESSVREDQTRKQLPADTRAAMVKRRLNNNEVLPQHEPTKREQRSNQKAINERRESLRRAAAERNDDKPARTAGPARRTDRQAEVRARLEDARSPVVERSRTDVMRSSDSTARREHAAQANDRPERPAFVPSARTEAQQHNETQQTRRAQLREDRSSSAAQERRHVRETAPRQREALRQRPAAADRQQRAEQARSHRMQRESGRVRVSDRAHRD